MRIYDVMVIGAGPAGIGAALQLRHNGFNPIVIERDRIGGRIRLARRVENLISSKPLTGSQVVKILRDMVDRKGIEVRFENVLKIQGSKDLYCIRTNINSYFARFIIIATGLKPVIPDIVGIDRLERNNLLFLEWETLNKRSHSPVLIIGGGEVGADSACSLRERGFEVALFSRSKNLEINPILKRDIKRLGVITITGISYKEIEMDKKVVLLKYIRGGKEFIASGRSILLTTGDNPSLSFLNKDVDKSRIIICGDANLINAHQAAIAFGDGVNAAMKISRLILKKE